MGLRLRLVVAQALVGACCVGASAELGPPAGAGSAPEADAARSARAQPSVSPRFERFTLRSPRLSAFSGEEVSFEAMVLTPPDYDPALGWATHYVIHGFGSSALRTGMGYGGDALDRHTRGTAPPLVRVYLDANHPLGHHVFADSATMGPWGSALVDELLPAIEARYGALAVPAARFVSGHSSGGWSSLWLQIEHPEVFGGVWSLAPDPVDFRDFVNVDLYRAESMYVDADGRATPLVREGGEVVTTLEAYVRRALREEARGRRVFESFDAVFSPRGEDGRPLRVFDRDTGRIDHAVAESWRRFDIRDRVRREWAELGPRLRGKVRVIVGTEDTYYLDRPARRLADELLALGSDAAFLFVPGRGHVDLFDPHPELYPEGLLGRIEGEMWAAFMASGAAPKRR